MRNSGNRESQVHQAERYNVLGNGAQSFNMLGLPVDVLELVCNYLDAQDVIELSRACKHWRDVATLPNVWVNLVHRSFLAEELPRDLEFLNSRDTPLIRKQFRKLTLQRPAFLSDAPRTCDVVKHTGSRFIKVLHLDGRRDFNFTTVFRDVPPGQYNVVWRLMLQPGYTRGYCKFSAVFSRPADLKASLSGQRKSRFRSTIAATAAATKMRLQQLRQPKEPKQDTGAVQREARQRSLMQLPGSWSSIRCNDRRAVNPATLAPVDDDLEDQEEEPMGHDPNGSPGRSGEATTKDSKGLQGGLANFWPPSCISAGGAAAREVGYGNISSNTNRESRGDGSISMRRSRGSEIGPVGGDGGGIDNKGSSGEAPDIGAAIACLTGAEGEALGFACSTPDQGAREPGSSQLQPSPPEQQQISLLQGPMQQRQASLIHHCTAPQHPEIQPLQVSTNQVPLQVSNGPLPIAWTPERSPRVVDLDLTPELCPQPEAPKPSPILQSPRQSANADADAAQQVAIGPMGPQPSPQPQPELLQRAMSQLATSSAKRDAALAGGGGPRYVPGLLAPLWGGYSSSWRHLDPSGPLGHGTWRSLRVGSLTVRRRVDAHLHGVMVQLRPTNAAQQQAALPPWETCWRGALLDYVELVPVRRRKLLGGLIPGFLQQRTDSAPLVSNVSELVIVPRL